jgi:phosphatidylglycerol:prolipoprotein diacylglycerol transferase
MIVGLLNFIVWDPNPVICHLGPVTLRYYATCWLIGLLLGYLLMHKLYKQQQIPEEKFDPLFVYIFLGVLIGARLGHCLFYQPDYFLTSWDHVDRDADTFSSHGRRQLETHWL